MYNPEIQPSGGAEQEQEATLESQENITEQKEGESENDKKVLDLESEEEALVSELLLEKKVLQQAEDVGITGFENHQEEFTERIRAIEEEKQKWVEEFGMENLPEGVEVATGENEWTSRLEIPSTEEQELTPEAKEARQKFIDEWKKSAVETFTKNLKNSWRTKDAVNLPVAVQFIEERLPKIMQDRCQEFIDGKTDELPETVYMNRQGTSFFDKIFSNEPEQIKDLKITFDQESIAIASEEELEDKKESPEMEKNNLEVESKESQETQEDEADTSPNNSQTPTQNTSGSSTASAG